MRQETVNLGRVIDITQCVAPWAVRVVQVVVAVSVGQAMIVLMHSLSTLLASAASLAGYSGYTWWQLSSMLVAMVAV